MAQQPRIPSRDAHTQAFDIRSLLRLALWGGAAAAALSVAVLSAQTGLGSQRIGLAMAAATGRGPQPNVQQASPVNAQLAARAAETEMETKRLSDALRALTADRDRLLTRLTAVERNLEDVTGSIKRQTAAVPAAPPPQASAPLAGQQPETAQVAAIPATEEPESDKPKVEYAVDVGGAVNFDGLRVLWNSSKATHGSLFEGLRPVFVARESKTHSVDLRLIVGPLASTEAATRLCATLLAARRICQMTTFEGQQFSLVVSEPERRPAAATPARPQSRGPTR